MFTLRTHVLICVALFAALIGIAILGNVLMKLGVPPLTGAARTVAVILYFALFVACGFSAVPVIVKLVISAQAGNQDVALIAAVTRRQNTIIWILWAIMAAGMLVAIPAAIMGGMFGDQPKRMIGRALVGKSLGVLAAKPNMTLDEMVAQSTLTVNLQYASTSISGGKDGPFEYRIPGSTMTFPGARYYYMTTFSKDSTRLEAVNIGISRDKQSPAEIDSADAELRKRLAADGWLTGHEVYKAEEDQTLHGGKTDGPEGRVWLKDDVVLTISRNRMDEAKAGEDTATAGEWIQYLQLWAANTFSGFDRFVFQPARP